MSVHLADLKWKDVQALVREDPVAVVPIGAFEQHGHHLPLRVDAFLCGEVARRSVEDAASRGAKAVVTPTVWTGYSPHHMDFPGTVTLDAETFMSLVMHVARSLHAHGFRKILLLNGHGGNMNLLKTVVQRLRFEHDVDVAAASYWDFALDTIASWRQSDVGGINHAGEMETALMLALDPDAVDETAREDLYLERRRHLPADLAVGGPVTRAATFAELSSHGAIGAPTLATPERGQELLKAMVEAVSTFVQDFAGWTNRTKGDGSA